MFYEMINFICIESNHGQYYDTRATKMTNTILSLDVIIYSSINKCNRRSLKFRYFIMLDVQYCNLNNPFK